MFQNPNQFQPSNGFNNPLAIIQKLQEFRQNPNQMVQYLLNSGRVPQQMSNFIQQNINSNPRQIAQYLLNYGMMSQQEFNQISQMANEFQKYLQ